MERSASSGEWAFEWDEDALIAQAAVRMMMMIIEEFDDEVSFFVVVLDLSTLSSLSLSHTPLPLLFLEQTKKTASPPPNKQEGVGDDVDVFYVGCLPSDDVTPQEQEVVALELYTSFRCCPVFLGAELRERHYRQFCKQQLWPLLHYLMPLSPTSAGRFDADLWGSYVKANKAFADVVVEVVGNVERDLVWVNDYHLLVLPSLLRKRLHRIRLGLSLHSPFPSSEIFRDLSPPGRGAALDAQRRPGRLPHLRLRPPLLVVLLPHAGLEHVDSRGTSGWSTTGGRSASRSCRRA